MPDIIKLLPDHVANQIAAGEVVQRPASVVKELLENAIDAGATKIHLVIKEAGRQLIQVIDNGKGMSVTDSRMAFERHATSKIASTEDIFRIKTKGFRGEALASIAAIAQLEMKTKLEKDEVGTLIRIHGGEIKIQEPTVTTTGTLISVSNLFYNVPARRNFLKSNNIEFRHILDEFHRVALAHENVEFRLTNNDQEIYRLNPGNLAQRIQQVFGKKMQGNLVPIEEVTDIVKISGFVGKPETAKKSRGEQFFFANHRFIKSPYLHKAIQAAFDNLIHAADHPAYFIFLELNPEKIDINIHPTKTEIKFEEETAIFAQLRAATKHALGQYQISPALDFDVPEWDLPIVQKDFPLRTPEIVVDKSYNPFQPEMKFGRNDYPKPNKNSYNYYDLESDVLGQPQEFLPIENQEVNQGLQWGNSYIITEINQELVLIDQHRAHQTVLYEKFINLGQNNTLSQQLLFPVEISITHAEKAILQESEENWIGFGFDMNFEDENVLISAIPAELEAGMIMPIITDFLSHQMNSENPRYLETMAKYMAKAAAIKKGTLLSKEQIQQLLQDLLSLEQFNYTPFGKKIYKSINLQELQKWLG